MKWQNGEITFGSLNEKTSLKSKQSISSNVCNPSIHLIGPFICFIVTKNLVREGVLDPTPFFNKSSLLSIWIKSPFRLCSPFFKFWSQPPSFKPCSEKLVRSIFPLVSYPWHCWVLIRVLMVLYIINHIKDKYWKLSKKLLLFTMIIEKISTLHLQNG